MNSLSKCEEKELELIQKENFRGISKDNVMQLMSIIDKVDPAVAKELISQIPEVISGIVSTEKVYAELLSRGIESCDKTIVSCYETEDALIQSLQKEIDREGTTFEQKQFYYEKMEAAAQRKENKDSEHRRVISDFLKFGGQALVVGALICAGIFCGRADFGLPDKKVA